MELQHFSHKHPLILGEVNDDGEAIVCNVCWEKISGSAFSCKNCLFFLHKLCAEFPEEMKYPIHAHSLTLQHSGSSRRCDVCEDIIRGFSYRCSPCDFDVDIRCITRQHFSHEHPLFLGEVNDDGEVIVCNVCWEKISGSAFSCKNCLFFLHKFCAEFPEEMTHLIHTHSLTLQQSGSSRLCGEIIRGFTYRCSRCNFDLDIRCSVRGQHFSSIHELMILNEDEKNDVDERVSCDVCLQQITGSAAAYKCTNCSISLYFHKFCAELPAEMEHPMHPEHPLALVRVMPSIFSCDGCDVNFKDLFAYHCSICNFNLDRHCALKAQKIKHESHKHPLSLLSSSVSFECYACGTERQGMSYMCDTCSFWIHYDCASLTPTFKHHNHIHPLTLIYPTHKYHSTYHSYSKCNICENSIVRGRFWLYVCIGCSFAIHVNCSSKTKERESAIKVENIDEANLIHLPMADDSISAIDLFLKQISMGDNKREAELNHFSHDHPLILFDAQGDNNLCYENELLVLNELNKDKICNACVRKISASFYNCGLCDFFLHKWCAELPNELEHPCHPGQLILLKKPPEPRGFFYCEGCSYHSNGFAFGCKKDECMDGYNYCLDVRCASLPKAIIHKVHEHPLFLKKHCVTAGCAACDRCIVMLAFGCDICNFNLHFTCAVLPDTIKHRYDEYHPFTLIYAPIKDGPDEYICEFCEEEIDPKWWFYHCIDCDQSACAKCICTERKKGDNIKWGSTYNFDSHSHRLVYVLNKSFDHSLCECCHTPTDEIGIKCEQCNIMLHIGCPHP